MGTIKTILGIMLAGIAFFYMLDAYDLTYTGQVIGNNGVSVKSLIGQQDALKEGYNANIQNVPNFIKTLFGDARINVNIEEGNKELIKRKIITKNGKIMSIEEGNHAKPDYQIWTAEATVDEILRAEKPIGAFTNALSKGDVTIKAFGIRAQAKLFAAKMVAKGYNLI